MAKSLGAYLSLCLVQAYDAELEVLPNPYARPGMPAIGGQLYVPMPMPPPRRWPKKTGWRTRSASWSGNWKN